MENYAFTRKAIDRAQRLDPEKHGLKLAAINEYLSQLGRLFWDDSRALFWVSYPMSSSKSEMHVAVWLMPVAGEFQPNEQEAA